MPAPRPVPIASDLTPTRDPNSLRLIIGRKRAAAARHRATAVRMEQDAETLADRLAQVLQDEDADRLVASGGGAQ